MKTKKSFTYFTYRVCVVGGVSQELEEGISSHQPSFAALNRTGDGIVQKLSPTDGSFLKDKLAGLNQRWGGGDNTVGKNVKKLETSSTVGRNAK